MTLNSVATAITSAPSVADIGFRGMSIASSTSADQPVASAIGSSGTSARPRRAVDGEEDEADGEQAGDGQPVPRARQLGAGVGGQHRQSDDLGVDAVGRVELGSDLGDQLLLLVERHDRDQEREARDVARVGAREDRLGEVLGHRLEDGVDPGPGRRAGRS